VLELRRAHEIHHERGGWFDARWHFSFDHYRDPRQMGAGPLRVFNDDRLVPAANWPTHPHADVEGCTYVVEGVSSTLTASATTASSTPVLCSA
jgi:redox-sensitive bicupin YhaK (pirin superfamily)